MESFENWNEMRSYKILLSFYQLYLDNVQDLLNPMNQNLNVWEADGDVFIEELVQVEVKGYEQAINILHAGYEFWEIA